MQKEYRLPFRIPALFPIKLMSSINLEIPCFVRFNRRIKSSQLSCQTHRPNQNRSYHPTDSSHLRVLQKKCDLNPSLKNLQTKKKTQRKDAKSPRHKEK